MKHTGILFSLAGCESLTAMFSQVVGDWTLYADWGSTGQWYAEKLAVR